MKNNLVAYFENFNEEMICELMKISKLVSYEKNSVIFYEGEEPIKLQLLIEGSVHIFKSEYSKQEKIIRFYKPTELIAELANVKNIPYPATARCDEKSKIIEIDYGKYLEKFCNNKEYGSIGYENLLKSISNKLAYHLNECAYTNIRENNATQKVAKLILEDLDKFNNEKNWKIAHDLGMSPETLSRTLAKLKKINVIKIKSCKITILDKSGLETLK